MKFTLPADRRRANVLSHRNSEHQVWVGAPTRSFVSQIMAANWPPRLTVILRTQLLNRRVSFRLLSRSCDPCGTSGRTFVFLHNGRGKWKVPGVTRKGQTPGAGREKRRGNGPSPSLRSPFLLIASRRDPPLPDDDSRENLIGRRSKGVHY